MKIKTNTPIGDGTTIAELKNQGFHTILLATGAQLSKGLKIEGVDLKGVLLGVDFLKEVNLGKRPEVKDRVVVIGGGNVAIDVALTCLRLGAKEVQLTCLESREEMPAHQWEIDEALEEEIRISASWGPKRISAEEEKVVGIELIRCLSVFDEEGRFNPSFDESQTLFVPTDMVIIAIGQTPDLSFLEEGSGIRSFPDGTIEADEDLRCQDGVFAAGDLTKLPGSVVDAIASGRKAAQAIDKYLGGEGIIDEGVQKAEPPLPQLGREEGFAERRRVSMPTIPIDERKKGFDEIELGFDEEMAIAEAKRCLRCDLRLYISPVSLPPEKWLEFNAENVAVVPETEGVYQLLDEKKEVIIIKGTANLAKDLKEQLETSKKACYFVYEEEKMYSKRESELLQQYLQRYGKLPEGGDELEDLF